MNFSIIGVLELLGALGFFIYGMKVMSEGIQKVAGSKMRQILRAMTSNRMKGVFTGFIITSLVQSSSATTVMVVSFVNAGLLTLVESIGVIMGANIGTTITAWLVSIIGFKVKISALALPIIAFGFPMLFSSKPKMKSWGEVMVGFALLFMGLAALKDAVPDLRSNPEILEFLSGYTDLGVLSTLLFILIGTVMTIVVQSSSAAMALTLVMANNGWITFDFAAAMVLGENIGTTITANLAALVGNSYAKRAARAHFIFNVFGVIWMIVIFKTFIGGVDLFMSTSYGVSPLEEGNSSSIPIALSIFHTSFNLINTFLLIWFVKGIAKVVEKMVPVRGDDEHHLEFIGKGIIRTPDISLLEARKEIARFGKVITKMSGLVQTLFHKRKDKKVAKFLERIHKYEQITDRVEVEVADFLTKVAEGNISEDLSQKVRILLSINNDLERIGDIYYQMSLQIQKKNESNMWFSEKQVKNMEELFELVDDAIKLMNNNLTDSDEPIDLETAVELERKINAKRDELRREHLKKIERGEYDVLRGMIYIDLVAALERVGDHVYNVSEAATGKV